MKTIGFGKMTSLVLGMLLYAGTMTGWAQSGDFGENDALHWELVDGTLTISGEGAMPDYYDLEGAPWYLPRATIMTVSIGEEITSIGHGAFYGCYNLISATIPIGVIGIGEYAFEDCTSLMAINVDAANSQYSSVEGVLYNKNQTTLHRYPTGRQGYFIIPNSVTRIERMAFRLCSGLASVTIPNSVTSIGSYAFCDVHGLTTITIPSSVTSIEECVFLGCRDLTAINVDVDNTDYVSEDGVLFNKEKTELIQFPTRKTGDYIIPVGVTSIGLVGGNQTFWDCIGLTSITIPNGLTSIGSMVFWYCSGLTSVINLSPVPQILWNNIFYGVPINNVTLYVPAGSLAAYQAAPVWQDFGKIVELTPHYIDASQSYPSTMTYTATVLLDNVELQSNLIEIGAFSGDECRGSAFVQQFPESTAHPFLGFLSVHGNANELITFRVYDHKTDKEYEATNALSFIADAICGDSSEPYPIKLVTKQEIALSEGWSWISANISNHAPSLIEQFKSTIDGAGIILKGRNAFIQAPLWIGNLSGITNEDMYMVKMNVEHTLSFTGNRVNPASTPIPLLNGWNWIGYPSWVTLPLNEALANINPQVNDQIGSQSAYSVYTDQGWVGTLTNLSPGNGYMYYSNNPDTQLLVYPSYAQSELRGSSVQEETLTPQWQADIHRYPNTLTATSIVLLDNVELQSDNVEIGAFSGDECRGSVFLKNFSQTDNAYLGFLTIHGEENESIELRIYDHASGREYNATNVLAFAANAIYGNPAEPYRIVSSPTGIHKIANTVNIYLEQINGNLQIHRPWGGIDKLEITDLTGRVVLRETNFTAESVNVSALTNSTYILKLAKDGQVYVKKFIKK